MHSGRAHANGKVFDPKHNDRNFNVAFAKNIKKDKLNLERYWNCYDKKEYGYFDEGHISFSDAELQYYNETFGHQLDNTNANYIKNRHPERVTTMDEWMYKKQNAPEEVYIQIGDSFGHPDIPNRQNNRKMVFDSMVRKKWIEIVRSHGIEVDDIPRNDVKHNLEKKDAIIQQLEIAKKDADKESERANHLITSSLACNTSKYLV